ncbi:AraC family transcriptional regulator [Kibdelosporangium lantanae]
MPENTEYFAVSPGIRYDALSDVLQAIHLRGGSVTRATDPQEHPAGSRTLHIVIRGEVRVEVPGEKPVTATAGELVLLARGDAHSVWATDAEWMTGEFEVERLVADPLLGVLPATITIRGTDETSAVPLSRDLILLEADDPKPGSRVMVSRVLDLLFVRALRTWAADDDHSHPGWLTAAMDPALSPALSAIHQHPNRDWSVDELARLAALSRSAFATRFTALMGQPPGAYVLRQRLDHAAHLLASTQQPVGRIAASVGYTSEAAFSRAFTREYGESPRTWRANHPA